MDQFVSQYRENGFAIVRNFMSEAQCDELIAYTEQMVQKRLHAEQQNITVFKSGEAARGTNFLETGDKTQFFYENDALDAQTKQLRVQGHLAFNKIGHAMHDLDPFFERICYTQDYVRLLRALGYRIPQLIQSMYIFKNPRIGGAVNVHTDNIYLYTRPFSTVGIWIALHDAHIENGCLWGVPGSHKQPTSYFMRRSSNNLGTEYVGKEPKYDLWNGIPLEVKRGSMIFFSGDFVHWSVQNKSEMPRHAFTLHFIEGAPGYQWDAGNWLQRGAHLPFRDYYATVPKVQELYK